MKKILLIITAIIGIYACGSKQGGDKKAELAKLQAEYKTLGDKIQKLQDELAKTDTSLAKKSKLVQIMPVTLVENAEHFIEVQGNVEAEENSLVGTRQPGVTISRILVKAGDNVRAGQVLAEGDASAMESSLEQMQVQYNLAKTAFERQENLWNQKIGTELQYLQAKTQKQALEKSISAMEKQISYSKIIAPFAGIVDEVKIKEGEMSAGGMNGIRLVNPNKLKVKANVADQYINKVKRGNKVIIHLSENDQEITSSVSYAGAVVNPASRTFNVEVACANALLKPNMVASIRINDAVFHKVPFISQNIIQQGESGSFVWLAITKDGKKIAHRVDVKTGMSYDGNVVVSEGLKEGDEIITTGFSELVEGQEIKL